MNMDEAIDLHRLVISSPMPFLGTLNSGKNELPLYALRQVKPNNECKIRSNIKIFYIYVTRIFIGTSLPQ